VIPILDIHASIAITPCLLFMKLERISFTISLFGFGLKKRRKVSEGVTDV